MTLLEMLKIEFQLIGKILEPYLIGFMVVIAIQFIVYRVFKFSIFNALVKVVLREMNK